MKASELRSKDVDALNGELEGLLKQHFSLRMQMATGQLGQPHLLKSIKRNIAKVKTVINEKSKGAKQ